MRPAAFFGGFLACFSIFAHAQEGKSPALFGSHYGYVFDVKEERNKRDIEMVMLEQPKEVPKPLREVIFNEKLSKEFQLQYAYRFGQSQAEQTLNTVGRSDDYTYFTGRSVTLKQYQKDQRDFAEYMARRLTEFHVDNWFKNDPDMRPVYELKDKVSNVSIKTKNGYKFDWKYNFAGPNMEAKVKNPYNIDFKVRMDMTGILSSPKELTYTVGYQFTPKVAASFVEKQYDGVSQLVVSRRLTDHLAASVTASVDSKDEGPAVKQQLYLIGFSWFD